MAIRLSPTNITCTKTSFRAYFPQLGNIKASFDPRCSNICDVTQLRTAECACRVSSTNTHTYTHTHKEREKVRNLILLIIVIIAMSAIPSIFSAALLFVLCCCPSVRSERVCPGEFPLVCANSWGL